MIRAIRCAALVRIPAWVPVSETAGTPRRMSAIASSGAAMVSPVLSSMSISRDVGSSDTSWARRSSSLVVLPMALTTTTTPSQPARAARIRSAT